MDAAMTSVVRKRGEGRRALIDAALCEFEEHGFDNTNSNAIARRAGYAPQTFYRHFTDKLEIFLAVYEHWSEAGLEMASGALDAESYARSLLDHHRSHRVFRRSLRYLTTAEPRMMSARTAARLAQLEAMTRRLPRFAARDRAGQIAILLMIERICDALADEEFAAAGIPAEAAFCELVTLLKSI